MNIANPIYDVIFKYLMSNKRIARYFIGTILDETVEDVQLQQQEIAYKNKENPSMYNIYRLDFVAIIKTADGSSKKVLIEIQKSRNYKDVFRFRDYLGEHYKKKYEIITANGIEEVALPIITIYLLGYMLSLKDAAVEVNRQYRNIITKEIIYEKDDFAEQLTHDCYLIQIPRIDGRIQTKIEELLSVFEQKNFMDEDHMIKEYDYPANNPELKYLLKELVVAGKDEEQRKYMIAEREFYRALQVGVVNTTNEMKQKMREMDKTIGQQSKELELAREEREILEKESKKQLAKAKKEQAEKDKQLADMAKQLADMKRKMGKH